MSRERKFRAWLKKEKKMVDVLSIDLEAKMIVFYNQEEEYEDIIREASAPFKDIELLEYIGLKDKDGNEIYEDDIVHICGFSNIDVVEYDSSYVGFVLKSYCKNGEVLYVEPLSEYTRFASPELEVIGNIYDNPELLEMEDE